MMYPEKYRFDKLGEEEYAKMLPEMILQLRKDFEMSGLDFELTENATPEQLVHYLSGKVAHLIRTDYGTYAGLLYRIDVPEHKIAAIKTGNLDELIGEITQLILEKQWQKVWFRIKSKS